MPAEAGMDSTRSSFFLLRLSSALRTALACVIVGCTTLYGPAPVRRLLAFPAFSYMTTILIVPDATLGDTLRGCWCALSASIQTLASSMLILKVVGPAEFTPALAAVAVASSAFLVALPESIPLMSKRIAFGQIVIVYVAAVVRRAQIAVVMHPIHVVLSTALGALASVLAMLVPLPRLAHLEARKACRLYIDNALERLNLFVEAIAAQDNVAATDLITQVKYMAERGAQHLKNIKDGQRILMWENPGIWLLKRNCTNPFEKLEDIEIKMRGLEIAITTCPSFPVGIIDNGLRELLVRMKEKICPKLEKAKFATFRAKTAPETTEKVSESTHWNPETSSITSEDLSAFFFMYCMQLLQDDSSIEGSQKSIFLGNTQKEEPQDSRNTKDQRVCSVTKIWNSLVRKLDAERWSFATKCSISLGLAVILGLIFNKDQGYWSGLTIAVSFVEGRQATFNVANARAQGTAMGSVYGILWCFIFHTYQIFRFLPLLPWIIFTGFLRHSRMYGEAGSIAAVVGALLILGRKNYGQPSEFAIARTTEACIGLLCFISLEIAVQPTRAATVAKTELVWSLKALRSCISDISFSAALKSMSSSIPWDLRMKQGILESHVNNLEKFISQAELEPNFWFLPFNGPCYGKLLVSLRQMTDLLLFAAYEVEDLLELTTELGPDWEEVEELLNYDLHIFREKVASSLICLEEVVSIKSHQLLEKKLRTNKEYSDPETGKWTDTGVDRLGTDDEEILEIVGTFIQHSDKVANKVNASEAEQQFKSRMIICLNALGFCINALMQGTKDIENQVKALVMWENPSRHINLSENSYKISRLQSK